jgi:hypothetical protein
LSQLASHPPPPLPPHPSPSSLYSTIPSFAALVYGS